MVSFVSINGQAVEMGDRQLEEAGKILNGLMNPEQFEKILPVRNQIKIVGFTNNQEDIVYHVRPGDSLYTIADNFDTTVDEIMSRNNLKSYYLHVGQELEIAKDEETVTYIVRPGDSLYKVAIEFDTSIQKIRQFNNWYSDYLYVGQKLTIPVKDTETALTYFVKGGDTLYKIAQKYNTSIETIKITNDLTSNYLYIGQKLNIPLENSEDDRGEENHRINVNDEEMELMAKAVYSEARGEPYEGQVAIAAVVINRVLHPLFPDSVREVIFQPWQFTAVHDGQFWLTPNQQSYQAVDSALEGWDPTGGAIYYYNPETATSRWVFYRKVVIRIGNHYFAV